MVKRMVNDMDFDALETKMKKCKVTFLNVHTTRICYYSVPFPLQELFYLLANQNDDEDGVVTASALGIELHAGGLTQEHVEYVSFIITYHSILLVMTSQASKMLYIVLDRAYHLPNCKQQRSI